MVINLFDYLGALFSLTSTLLYAKSSIWAWPLCIITNLVNLYLFYHTGIYADAFLEVIYLALAIYGILHWLYGGNNKQKLLISNLPVSEAILISLFMIAGYYGVHYLLTHHTNSTVAQLDALAMVISMAAQWLMCRKYIQTWIFWFIADVVLGAMFYFKQLPAHMLLNLIYLPITFYGYYHWAQLRAKQSMLNNNIADAKAKAVKTSSFAPHTP